MPIIFEGLPPYEPLGATSATVRPLIGTVELTLTVAVDGLAQDSVPIAVILDSAVAHELAVRLGTAAQIAQRWESQS